MGLMKIATYYRESGDDVRFFKGDLRDLAADIVIDELLDNLKLHNPQVNWKKYKLILIEYIRIGKAFALEECEVFNNDLEASKLAQNAARYYRKK